MLRSIRLRNLRGFANDEKSPFVDIKPLTVFVGKNSSGKSSFLRSLPLLRQSVEENTTGPILWFGSYVDFGAFSEARNNSSKENIIYFDFLFNLAVRENSSFSRWGRQKKLEEESLEVRVEVGVTEYENKTVAKELRIHLYDYSFLLEYDREGRCQLQFEGESIEFSEPVGAMSKRGFLPSIGVIVPMERKGDKYKLFDEEYILNHFYDRISHRLKSFFHGKTSFETIRAGVDQLGLLSLGSVGEALRKAFQGNTWFYDKLKSQESSVCLDVHKLLLKANLPELIERINREVESTFGGVRYIAPLRATAERYYRHQDLQINEIDHTGSNLAMLLRSFSSSERRRFSEWTKENFGFSIRVEELGLHYALKIRVDTDETEYNINDMGFGFSQILPIVTSIWMETYSTGVRRNMFIRKRRPLIFAIEQPELHLHPEYQSRLAKMFATTVSVARERGVDLRILFETHSKSMVDSLGECIEEKVIHPEDVNISIFQKNSETKKTEILFSKFDDQGYLCQWPVGFFSGR